MHNRRQKVWIHRFQALLAARVACYFLLFQVLFAVFASTEPEIVSALELLFGRNASGFFMMFRMGAALLLVLVLTFDALRFAHRVVGPIIRFRKAIQAITAGEPVDLIELRNHDLLTEMRDELNAMIEALNNRGAITINHGESPTRAETPTAPVSATV
jgi:hypothetical protein